MKDEQARKDIKDLRQEWEQLKRRINQLEQNRIYARYCSEEKRLTPQILVNVFLYDGEWHLVAPKSETTNMTGLPGFKCLLCDTVWREEEIRIT